MTLLIFKTAMRTFATTAWTAQTGSIEHEVKITFLGDQGPGSAEQRVYFLISMEEFLAKKVGDTIDMRS